jgi:hypothetical protein
MTAIPAEVIRHCQQYQGCSGCPVRNRCADIQRKATSFQELMESALLMIQVKP